MIESEASVKGRVVAEMLSHFTNDLKIGKKIKSGELRTAVVIRELCAMRIMCLQDYITS